MYIYIYIYVYVYVHAYNIFYISQAILGCSYSRALCITSAGTHPRQHTHTHTHTHIPRAFREHRGCATPAGTQFACFTGTNIQILTQKRLNLLALFALLGRRAPEAGQRARKRFDRCGRAAPLGRQVSVCCLDGTCSTGSARKRERHGNVAAGEHAEMCGARCGRICTFVLALLGLTST